MRLNWLHRLITSTTFPSSNHIRDKDNNYKEAQGHTHCNRNKKVEVRVSRTVFSCQKRTDREQGKGISKECNWAETRYKHFENIHGLVFYNITPIFYFLSTQRFLSNWVSLSIHLNSHLVPQYKEQKLREERESIQNTELPLP